MHLLLVFTLFSLHCCFCKYFKLLNIQIRFSFLCVAVTVNVISVTVQMAMTVQGVSTDSCSHNDPVFHGVTQVRSYRL